MEGWVSDRWSWWLQIKWVSLIGPSLFSCCNEGSAESKVDIFLKDLITQKNSTMLMLHRLHNVEKSKEKAEESERFVYIV